MGIKPWAWIGAAIAFGSLAACTDRLAAAATPDTAPVTTSAPCASTPAGALAVAVGKATGAKVIGSAGFRVEAVRWDPLLHQSWAVVQSCEHGEHPSLTMLTDMTPTTRIALASGSTLPASRVAAGPTVVRAGDVVRLWKMDSRSHIETIATSEENGSVGMRVRVRLSPPRDADGQVTGQPQYLAGVVRGAADVEMEP